MLTVHLVWCAIRRSRVARVLKMAIAIFLKLLNTTGGCLVLPGNLGARLVADWRELDRSCLVSRRGAAIGILAVSWARSRSLALLVLLPLVLFFLLASLPLLADLLELFRSTLVAVGLHSNMGIEMIQSAICLFTSIPSTFVHALDFFVSSSGSLVLLCTRNWNEGIDLSWTRSSWSSRCWGLRTCNGVTWQPVLRMATIACPVRSWLSVHRATWVGRVTVLHLFLRWVWGVLAVLRRVSRTRRRD